MTKDNLFWQAEYLKSYLKRGGDLKRWLNSKDFLEKDRERIFEFSDEEKRGGCRK